MNKTNISVALVVIAAFFGLLVLTGAFYVVSETEQAIVTQFGKPVGAPISQAGVHFKMPFVQKVNRIEERVLEWDGPSAVMTTKDKLFIIVDAFGRWQITDPLQFFKRLRDERSALSRLDDILGSEMRNTIARHELVELVRTTKGRAPALEADPGLAPGTPPAPAAPAVPPGNVAPTTLRPIQYGRVALEEEIGRQARDKLKEFGIELLDLRFKRINYNPEVSAKIFERMMSERKQIAERFRSEGAGEAARIIGKKERDLQEIDSEAYRKVEAIKGKADGEATAIYASAFNQSPQSREFYEFQRALETYRTAFSAGTTVVLTTDSGFLRFLKGDAPEKAAGKPGAAPAEPRVAPAPAP